MAAPSSETAESKVDYDFAPIAEVEVDDTQYRVDAGFRGAVAISSKSNGSWSWAVVAEGRWDGLTLKAKALDRPIVAELEKALRAAATATD
jgi:hypothetical protein